MMATLTRKRRARCSGGRLNASASVATNRSEQNRNSEFGIPAACLLALSIILFLGCSKNDSANSPVEPAVADEDSTQTNAEPAKLSRIEKALNGVEALLEKGAVDKAAAQLVQLRMKGANFNRDEAAAYRDLLTDVYDRALDGVEQGDPKAKTAVQILNASSGF